MDRSSGMKTPAPIMVSTGLTVTQQERIPKEVQIFYDLKRVSKFYPFILYIMYRLQITDPYCHTPHIFFQILI